MFESLNLTNLQIQTFFDGMCDITGKQIDWKPMGADFAHGADNLLPYFLKKKRSPRVLKFEKADFSPAAVPLMSVPAPSGAIMTKSEKVAEKLAKTRNTAHDVSIAKLPPTSSSVVLSNDAATIESFPTCIDDFLSYFSDNTETYVCSVNYVSSLLASADYYGAPFTYYESDLRDTNLKDLNSEIVRVKEQSEHWSKKNNEMLDAEVDNLLAGSYPVGVSVVHDKFIELDAAFCDSSGTEFQPPPNATSGKDMIAEIKTVKDGITSKMYGVQTIHDKLMATGFFDNISIFLQMLDLYTYDQVMGRQKAMIASQSNYTSMLQEYNATTVASSNATAALLTETKQCDIEKASREKKLADMKQAETDRTKGVDTGIEEKIVAAHTEAVLLATETVTSAPTVKQTTIDTNRTLIDKLEEKRKLTDIAKTDVQFNWAIYAWMVFHQSISEQLRIKKVNIFYHTEKA